MTTSDVNKKEVRARRNASSDKFFDTLSSYREIVFHEIVRTIPKKGRYYETLYKPMLEYPSRSGKALRPALCLATCQACGGKLEHALDTAVALEMFHNAFLIHDDIEDGSEMRRGQAALHVQEGTANAANIGDALNMLALQNLLKNTHTVGLERALVIVQEACLMAKETTEGQSLELNWVFDTNNIRLGLRDYLTMTWKKTAWYTCISPMRLGAIIADVPDERLYSFIPLGMRIGNAFQIQDDVLNIASEEALYGKELNGDIAEGKRTLMFIHVFANASIEDKKVIAQIYSKPRLEKTQSDIEFVLGQFESLGSVEYARKIARSLSKKAEAFFYSRFDWIPDSSHRAFIESLIEYMVTREF